MSSCVCLSNIEHLFCSTNSAKTNQYISKSCQSLLKFADFLRHWENSHFSWYITSQIKEKLVLQFFWSRIYLIGQQQWILVRDSSNFCVHFSSQLDISCAISDNFKIHSTAKYVQYRAYLFAAFTLFVVEIFVPQYPSDVESHLVVYLLWVTSLCVLLILLCVDPIPKYRHRNMYVLRAIILFTAHEQNRNFCYTVLFAFKVKTKHKTSMAFVHRFLH